MLKIKLSKGERESKPGIGSSQSRIKYLLNEVKLELLKAVFIHCFLDAIMVFFISYFLLTFFEIPFIYLIGVPGGITLIFFVISLFSRAKKLRMKTMEDANPQIKEMLRTANDNRNQENVMALALFEELRQKMKGVSGGNLLESKKIVIRIASAIAIVFLIIFVSTLNINVNKIDINFDSWHLPFGNSDDAAEGRIIDLVFNETEVIYGDADIAKLGNEKINLNLNPSMSDIDFNDISEAEKDNLRQGEVPGEIGVDPDVFSNNKLLDEAEQAVEYSQRIKDI